MQNNSFSIHSTQRSEMLEVTRQVQQIIDQIGVNDGIVLVYIPHTTAGITINENADPDVSTAWHVGIHICANIGNILLYNTIKRNI